MPDQNLTHSELRALYARGVNIMGLFREAAGVSQNTADAIQVSYDLQSGSYVAALEDPVHREKVERYGAEIAAALEPLEARSMLEAGIGEATTLCSILKAMARCPEFVAGFDISWSRLAFARLHLQERGAGPVRLFTGSLLGIPMMDGAADLVYTAHAVEPNHGKEREILQELYRVTRRWLVLFEPSYELGSETTRRRIEDHGYCRGLPRLVEELGWKMVDFRLLENSLSERNQTALIMIEKPPVAGADGPSAELACPLCRGELQEIREQLFCVACGRVFPVLDEIPCLLGVNGILASKFPDLPPQ